MRQSLDQQIYFLVGGAATRKRGERQSGTEFREALENCRRELSEALAIPFEARDDTPVRLSLERGLRDQACREDRLRGPRPFAFYGGGQARSTPLAINSFQCGFEFEVPITNSPQN